jgi:hypothetical protein
MMNPAPPPTFSALLRSARAALQWRLLLLWVGLMLLPVAILTVPMWQMLSNGLDRSVHAAALAQQLDLVALTDLMSMHGKNAMAFTTAGVLALLVTLLTGVLLALAHASVDAGRAQLAIERRRRSVVKAWWAGCGMLWRRPLHGLGAYLAIGVAGLGLAGALAIARLNVSGASLGGFLAALLLVQLTVAVLGWMRSARLFALVALARSQQR